MPCRTAFTLPLTHGSLEGAQKMQAKRAALLELTKLAEEMERLVQADEEPDVPTSESLTKQTNCHGQRAQVQLAHER